jgi:hypothetical protein
MAAAIREAAGALDTHDAPRWPSALLTPYASRTRFIGVGDKMIKCALNAAAILVAMSAPALAAGKIWYVTEVGTSGITGSQGTWTLTIDNNKISGIASMQFDNGNMLSYDVDGSLNEGIYTISMSKRTDNKKDCVWTGHIPAAGGAITHGLVGKVTCDGGEEFFVRASF